MRERFTNLASTTRGRFNVAVHGMIEERLGIGVEAMRGWWQLAGLAGRAPCTLTNFIAIAGVRQR